MKLLEDIRKSNIYVPFQAEYYNDLASLGGVENIKPYVLKLYEDMSAFRVAHASTYRCVQYRIVDDKTFTKTLEGQPLN